MLGSLPEKKALVYFASGMTRNGMDNQAQLHATINAAIRSNVSFYPIDARGLVAIGAAGRRHQRLAGRPGHVFGQLGALGRRATSRASRKRFITLAADTGGKALLDNNDLAVGIVQAQKDISSYYIIGYYTHQRQPGRPATAASRSPSKTASTLPGRQARLPPADTSPARNSVSSTPRTKSGSLPKP